ncbi:MAG: hypothetical protein ACOZCL_15440 [Bacillota bacterium]
MNVLRFTHVFYFAFTWALVFILIKPKRIIQLLPVAVLGILAITIVDVYIISLGLYKFNNPLANVWGAPLFHLLWAGAAAIILVNYMKEGFNRKAVIILFFTIVTLVLEYIAEAAGVAERLGKYSYIHSGLLDFVTLVVLLWVAEGLYGNRIYLNKNKV